MTHPLIAVTADYAQQLQAHVDAGNVSETDALAYLACDTFAAAMLPDTPEDTAQTLLDMVGQWATSRRRLMQIEGAAALFPIPDDLRDLDPRPRPRPLTVDDVQGERWSCWHCAQWGFAGDLIGRYCEECASELCEECASVHDCRS